MSDPTPTIETVLGAAQEGSSADAEYETLSLSYVTGGMTISAGMHEADNANFGTASNQDFEKWTLGASFAF